MVLNLGYECPKGVRKQLAGCAQYIITCVKSSQARVQFSIYGYASTKRLRSENPWIRRTLNFSNVFTNSSPFSILRSFVTSLPVWLLLSLQRPDDLFPVSISSSFASISSWTFSFESSDSLQDIPFCNFKSKIKGKVVFKCCFFGVQNIVLDMKPNLKNF